MLSQIFCSYLYTAVWLAPYYDVETYFEVRLLYIAESFPSGVLLCDNHSYWIDKLQTLHDTS